MFSTEEKFEYFLNIERQIHVIIKANYKHNHVKIVNKIIELINIQNSKSALCLELDTENLENGSISLFLKEIIPKKGYKRIFQTIISIKAIIREIRLDIILGK